MSLVLLVFGAALLAGIVWGLATRSWLVAAGCAAVLIAGVVWAILLLRAVERTYLYAGTRHALQEIAGELRNYHEQHGSFPAGLKVVDLGNPRLPGPEAGWGYVMTVADHSFSLTSLALDGKPGGEKYDQDIIVSWKAGDRSITTQSAPISP